MVLCLCQMSSELRTEQTEKATYLRQKCTTSIQCKTNILKDRFTGMLRSWYLGSCGGPACPVMMKSMGLPLRWLYSIRTDTGFLPPGSDRDRGWQGPSTAPSTPLEISPAFSTDFWQRKKTNYITTLCAFIVTVFT